MQAKEDNPKGVGFVYLPASFPEIMMTVMWVRVRALIRARNRKRSPSSAIVYINQDMANMVFRRLKNKTERSENMQKQERPGHLLSHLHGVTCPSSCLSIPRAGIPEHLTVNEEKALTLTWMKEHRRCQHPRHIWQGPTQHREKPVERGSQGESGSRAP